MRNTMTIQMTPGTRLGRVLIALAVANVLGFSAANAATITMLPLHPAQAGSQIASRTCGSDHAAGFSGPAFAEYPPIAQLQGIAGETRVRVDLSEHGKLRTAAVDRSSGNPWLDKAAVAAARNLRYSPEVTNCEAVAGSYALNVQFGDPG
jgi:TonB family protein